MTEITQNQLRARQRQDIVGVDETPIRIRMRRIRAGLSNAWHELLKSRTATIGAVMIACLLVMALSALIRVVDAA